MRLASPELVVAALAALALAAAPASATESCSFDSGDARLTIKMTDGGDWVRTYVSGGTIHVERVTPSKATIPLSCDGDASPTTIDTVMVRDKSKRSTELAVLDPIEFVPGLTSEPLGADEIEWDVRMGRGSKDVLFLSDLNGVEDEWRFGDLGVNINPSGTPLTEDREYDLRGVDKIEALGGDEVDILSGEGDAGTGQVFANRLYLQGGSESDFIFGGRGNDVLGGYFGDDSLKSGNGNDKIEGGTGEDTLLGQGGIDKLDAQEPGPEADAEINCGPGDNSQESAKLDSADPAAISC